MTLLKKWKTLKSQLVFDNPWCRVRQDEVELPNGQIVDDYFVNLRPDIALVVPIASDKQFVFVRQYRHGIGKILLEFPAGAFDPEKEDSQAAAMRELQEETGYVAQNWVKLGTVYNNPVKDTNTIHTFLAEMAVKVGNQALDMTEEIEVVLVPISEAMNLVLQGQICVSGSIAALTFALNYLTNSHQLRS